MKAKKFFKLSGKKFVAQHWRSEFFDVYSNAWRFAEWMIRQLRASNSPDADEKIAHVINTCWQKYPLF